MKEHPLFPWDHHSDQPHVMRDKKQKMKIYFKSSGQMIKAGLLLICFPFIFLIFLLRKQWSPSSTNRVIGLSVHLETQCSGKTIIPLSELTKMVDDLKVSQLLVRIKLADIENFDTYIKHIDALSSETREVSINLIQDRQLLDDPDLLKKALRKLLPLLKSRTKYIHVGNAYNRRKWAFYHFGEYHKFFQCVREESNELCPEIKLIGGSVIDFEIPPFLESMFHLRKGSYDGYSSQLYVDRRGAPENTQSSFDFLKKINLISLMHKLSWKTSGEFWISEINWPLKNTGKFSPCHGSALVDPQTQANYLVRSYLIAMASGNVRTCFWHQLVAPGYGLVDNRDKNFIKYPSYQAFKTLIRFFGDAKVTRFHNGNYLQKTNIYAIEAHTSIDGLDTKIIAIWSHDIEQDISLDDKIDRWVNQDGTELVLSKSAPIQLSNSVIYGISSLS